MEDTYKEHRYVQLIAFCVIASSITILYIYLSCGGNQQKYPRIKSQQLQRPLYPTFRNEIWPALKLHWRQPAYKIANKTEFTN